MKKALVTIAIGDFFVRTWESTAKANWLEYTQRHGYDLFVIDQPIDPDGVTDAKSLHWQKLLVLTLPVLQEYDVVVWMDTDIVINTHRAPCIASAMRTERIGGVNTGSCMNGEADEGNLGLRLDHLLELLRRQCDLADGSFPGIEVLRDRAGQTLADPKPLLNTGVMVMRPALHRDLLEGIYRAHEGNGKAFDRIVSEELIGRGEVEFLDGRFNMIWALSAARHYPFLFEREQIFNQTGILGSCVNTVFANSWFLHFPGSTTNPLVKRALFLVDTGLTTARHIPFPAWEEEG